jgi:hypothetical protein
VKDMTHSTNGLIEWYLTKGIAFGVCFCRAIEELKSDIL